MSDLANGSEPDTAIAEPPQLIPTRKRLSQAQINTLFHLHKAGRTQVQIAQELGCTQGNVSQWLSLYPDSRDEASNILNAGAKKLAKRIIDESNPATALETLDRLGVTEKRAPAGAGKGTVNVFIGGSENQVNIGLIESLSPSNTQDLAE